MTRVVGRPAVVCDGTGLLPTATGTGAATMWGGAATLMGKSTL